MGLDPLLVAGQLFSFSTLMLLVGSLTCKTVSRMTYTVLVETLNPTHSLTHLPVPRFRSPRSTLLSINVASCSTLSAVTTRMGDCLRT